MISVGRTVRLSLCLIRVKPLAGGQSYRTGDLTEAGGSRPQPNNVLAQFSQKRKGEIHMHANSKLFIALSAIPLSLAAPVLAQAPANTLVVAKAATAPVLDGVGNDAAWAAAQPLTVKASGGANFKNGETTATLKAVTAGDMIYFLIQYDDPTQSVKR